MSKCFVIGNGTSRQQIDLNLLQPCGKTYGCNALYRDFIPDHLIAVDPKMIFEIQESGYQLSHNVWTNYNKDFAYDQGFNYFSPRLGWSSGSSALYLAAKHWYEEIYILGFDFVGLEGKFNNVYADTRNYMPSESMQIYWGNWENQYKQVIRSNPDIKFYRVVDENFYDPGIKFPWYKNIKIEEFLKHININFKKMQI